MPVTGLGSEQLTFLLVSLGLLAFAITGALLHVRHEWTAVRHKLFKSQDGRTKLARPGRIAERLTSARWDAAFRETIGMARREAGAEGGNVAAALEAVEAAEESLRPLVDSVALDAMTSGDLKSALLQIDKVIVYVLVFPGRHDDRRALRRYEAFSDGWPAHAAAVRRAARDGESALPMVALLYFLGLDAHDGTLLVAYEGDDEHRYPKELSEVSGGPAVAEDATSLTYKFALA
jgi:hypothetical protein